MASSTGGKAAGVPESVRPAAVCHLFGLASGGHFQDVGHPKVVVPQHWVQSNRGDRFAVIWRDFDTSESQLRVVEMRVFRTVVVGADFILSVQYPQLRLVSRP